MVNKLKHRFNQLFDDLFIEKQRQLDNLKEYQDRLTVIETELRMACKGIRTKVTERIQKKILIIFYFYF